MKSLLCTLSLLCLNTAPVIAGETPGKPNTLTAKEIADGWILLFDGETTFGWKTEGTVAARDGLLVISGPAKATLTSIYREWELNLDSVGQGQLLLSTDDGKVSAGLSNQSLHLKATVAPMGGFGITVRAGNVNQSEFVHNGTKPVTITLEAAEGKSLELSSIKLKPLGLNSVFNGKDLTGWKVIPGHKSQFGVNDKGELTIKNGNGDIQTESQWDDFVLQVEVFSHGPHLNSGVFFRSIPGEFWAGYEAQIRNEWVSDVVLKDGSKLSGSLTITGDQARLEVYNVKGNQATAARPRQVKNFAKADIEKVIDHRDIPIDYGTGALYRRQAARKVVSNDGEWFTMTIVANGAHIAIWVNGYQTVDFTDTRPPADNARNGRKVTKGVINLQGHDPTTDLGFRNIRIAALP